MCLAEFFPKYRDKKKKRNECPRIFRFAIFSFVSFFFSICLYNANTNLIISYRTLYSVSLKRTSIYLFIYLVHCAAHRAWIKVIFLILRKNARTCIKKEEHTRNHRNGMISSVSGQTLCTKKKHIQIVYIAFTHVIPPFLFQPSVSFSRYYYYYYY